MTASCWIKIDRPDYFAHGLRVRAVLADYGGEVPAWTFEHEGISYVIPRAWGFEVRGDDPLGGASRDAPGDESKTSQGEFNL